MPPPANTRPRRSPAAARRSGGACSTRSPTARAAAATPSAAERAGPSVDRAASPPTKRLPTMTISPSRSTLAFSTAPRPRCRDSRCRYTCVVAVSQSVTDEDTTTSARSPRSAPASPRWRARDPGRSRGPGPWRPVELPASRRPQGSRRSSHAPERRRRHRQDSSTPPAPRRTVPSRHRSARRRPFMPRRPGGRSCRGGARSFRAGPPRPAPGSRWRGPAKQLRFHRRANCIGARIGAQPLGAGP